MRDRSCSWTLLELLHAASTHQSPTTEVSKEISFSCQFGHSDARFVSGQAPKVFGSRRGMGRYLQKQILDQQLMDGVAKTVTVRHVVDYGRSRPALRRRAECQVGSGLCHSLPFVEGCPRDPETIFPKLVLVWRLGGHIRLRVCAGRRIGER